MSEPIWIEQEARGRCGRHLCSGMGAPEETCIRPQLAGALRRGLERAAKECRDRWVEIGRTYAKSIGNATAFTLLAGARQEAEACERAILALIDGAGT